MYVVSAEEPNHREVKKLRSFFRPLALTRSHSLCREPAVQPDGNHPGPWDIHNHHGGSDDLRGLREAHPTEEGRLL